MGQGTCWWKYERFYFLEGFCSLDGDLKPIAKNNFVVIAKTKPVRAGKQSIDVKS